MILFIVMLNLGWQPKVFGQSNMGIGTVTPDNSSILDINSNSQGVLVPRLNSIQRTNIPNPADGLLVYDTDAGCFFFYQTASSSWLSLCNTGGPIGATGPTGAVGPTEPSGGPQGPTGPAGVSTIETYSTTGTGELTASSTFITAPGLSLDITLTDSATLTIFTNGIIDQSSISTYYIRSEVQIFINNSPVPTALQTKKIETMSSDSPNIYNWSIATPLSLPQGNYVIDVRVRKPDGCSFKFGSNTASSSSLIIQVTY